MTTQLLLAFDESDIAAVFPPAMVRQGFGLYERGAVEVVPLGNSMVTACVTGGRSRRVVFVGPCFIDDDTDILDMPCSCRADDGCKHVVAMLYALLARAGALRKPSAANAASTHRIIYVIGSDCGWPTIDAYLGKPKSSGGYLMLRLVDWGELFRRPPKSSTAEDTALADLMRKAKFDAPAFCSDHNIASEFMRVAIGTGRAFWRSPQSSPLTMGERLGAELQWIFDEKTGDQRLTVAGRGRSMVAIVPLAEPWYVDEESALCGPTDLHLSLAALRFLADPIVSAEEVKFAAEHIRSSFLLSSVPLPRMDIDVTEVSPNLVTSSGSVGNLEVTPVHIRRIALLLTFCFATAMSNSQANPQRTKFDISMDKVSRSASET